MALKMNRLSITGLVMAGMIILTDHIIFSLPHYAAVILYTAAMILIIFGMIRPKKDPE